jgi:phosphohistidine phosphatase SixA
MRMIVLLWLLLAPLPVWANDWDALRAPGAIAIMRHALAPGVSDPANHTIDDCTTQRNLSAQGHDQAREIGAELRARGISFDHVLTSQWCRTRDTAALLDLGTPADAPPLNSFFEERGQRDSQTRDLRILLEGLQGRAMLVTHQVNISALTGTSTRSGEIVVFRLTPNDTEILGRILIAP